MKYDDILEQLKSMSNPQAVNAMARFGIQTQNAYGISIPQVRHMAAKIGTNQQLAQKLWESNIHEARILAGLIADPRKFNEKLLERWVMGFNSWDLCDQCCNNLFRKTKLAWSKAKEWPHRSEPFVKRAGFVLMAALAVHDKDAENRHFKPFLSLIQHEADDDRNFVKKAVNWALRQIGKCNPELNRHAIQTAQKMLSHPSASARWIARDALRELQSAKVQKRLQQNSG